MKKAASIISIIFHPFAITPLVFMILCFDEKSLFKHLNTLAVALTFSTFIPFITFIFLKKVKLISDYNISRKEERIKPLLISSFYFLLGFLLLSYSNSKAIIQGLMFCYCLNTIFTAIITKFWKISLHAISIAGPLTALWINGLNYPITMLLIIIVVCLSRFILGAHTLPQVIAGASFAFILTYFELQILFI